MCNFYSVKTGKTLTNKLLQRNSNPPEASFDILNNSLTLWGN